MSELSDTMKFLAAQQTLGQTEAVLQNLVDANGRLKILAELEEVLGTTPERRDLFTEARHLNLDTIDVLLDALAPGDAPADMPDGGKINAAVDQVRAAVGDIMSERRAALPPRKHATFARGTHRAG